jgi:hypothetical protein
MNRITAAWTELIEPAYKSTMSLSGEHASIDMFIRVPNTTPYTTVPRTICQILGFAATYHPTGTLVRNTPVRHPRFPWLYASDVSVEGIGPASEAMPPQTDGAGTYGEFGTYIFRIKFEARSYQVQEDTAVTAEYMRWNEWEPLKPMFEVISRRGQRWVFSDPGARLVNHTFNDERNLRIPKGQLSVTWRDVPVDFVFRGNLLSTKIANGMGKVNSMAFPAQPIFPLQPGQTPWTFGPGTLLALSPDVTLKNQIPVQLFLQVGNPFSDATEVISQVYSKTCDIKFNFLYFDPPSDDTAVVNTARAYNVWNGLTAYRIGDEVLTAFNSYRALAGNTGINPVGSHAIWMLIPPNNVTVRGHNLVPLPRPTSTGFSWYTCSNEFSPAIIPPSNVWDRAKTYATGDRATHLSNGYLSRMNANTGNVPVPAVVTAFWEYDVGPPTYPDGDRNLLYQYYDFAKFWEYAG